MIDPIVTDQNLTENFKFKLQSGHGKMIVPPIIFTNQNLTENFKFEIELDMERWLTPIVTDQNVTENLKLKIWLWNGMMINPPLLPTRISLKVLYLWMMIAPHIVADHNLTENLKFRI